MYLKDLEKVSIDDLSLKDRLYLATLLREVNTFERDGEIIVSPIARSDIKIAPTEELHNKILFDLIDVNIIVVDYKSSIDLFSGDLINGDYAYRYYIYRVNYILNIEYDKELINPILIWMKLLN